MTCIFHVYNITLLDRHKNCARITVAPVLNYLVKHPDEIEGHDALVVTNHADGVKARAPQVLPCKPEPARLVTCIALAVTVAATTFTKDRRGRVWQ